MRTTLLALAIGSVAAGQWLSTETAAVQMRSEGQDVWKLVSSASAEQTIESEEQFAARPGDTFEVSVRLRVDTSTKALPELVSYDANGNEILGRSSLAIGPTQVTTDWLPVRRVFAAAPGAASVRARIRFSGRGEILVGHMDFNRKTIDPYETGALYSPIYPNRRRGLVLSPALGIVNTAEVSRLDRDGDGKWALITIDLDKASEPDSRGEDWRTSFKYRPNELYWFDGAVLKSDSVRENREPDLKRALHYRARVHAGPYQVIMNDPGRAVAISTDGETWRRFEGGAEAELGHVGASTGFIDLWVDACYRDATSAGPVYFDYVRLFPTDHAPSAETLFRAARQTPSQLSRGSARHRKVAVSVTAPKFAAGRAWPVRSGIPIPRGELASPRQVMVTDAAGRRILSSSRTMASWPDGSVKWLFTDFHHDFSASPAGTYEVHYGNDIGAASGEGAAVQIRETGRGIEVDTGAIRFLVSNTRFGIVESVRLASGRALQTDPIIAEIREPGGRPGEPRICRCIKSRWSKPGLSIPLFALKRSWLSPASRPRASITGPEFTHTQAARCCTSTISLQTRIAARQRMWAAPWKASCSSNRSHCGSGLLRPF